MGAKEQIQEYISSLNLDDDMQKRIDEEISLLDASTGVDDKNNLNTIFELWKKHKDSPGHENKINSWLAYYLGITSCKPDGEFMTERRIFARSGFPDIDTDFDDERRDEIFEYLIEKYGRDNVGNIGTYGTLKMKSVIQRVTKAVDAAYAFHKGSQECRTQNSILAQEISNSLGASGQMGAIKGYNEDGEEVIIKNIKDAYRYLPEFKSYMDKYPDIYRHAKSIEGNISNSSIHAAGVVISDISLRNIAPMKQSKKGLATQFTGEELESIGLIKFDILAIATLTVIRDTIELIKENYDIELDVKNLPLDDKPTLDLYKSGQLKGVFQCENGGMQETMRNIGVDSFKDVIAAIALYRPGPMDSIPEYVARKKGLKSVDYFHSSIEPYVKDYLKDTYGVLVYQESVMQICNSLAGFSITDGYVMIKAIGKKKQNLMNKFEKQFIQGCIKNGVTSNTAKQYWDKFITPFASYGFNKSHSACYAILSWQTCYLKANYPDEFMCALLNTLASRAMRQNAAEWDKVKIMEKEAKSLGIKILPRNINDCGIKFEIVKKKDAATGVSQTEIQPPIACKGVGFEAAKDIAKNRPYKGLDELAEKTDKSKVTSETIGALIDNGYMKGKKTDEQRQQFINRFNLVREDLKKSKAKGIKYVDLFA